MFAKAIDGWQPRTRGEFGDAFPLLEEHTVYKHDDRLHIARSTMLANTPAAERMSARSKSRRWRNWVAVFLLRNSRIKLHLQQWNRLNSATRAVRFLNLILIRRLSRGVEQQ
jgi:hypothetical protein